MQERSEMPEHEISNGPQYVQIPVKAVVAILVVLNIYPLFLAVMVALRFPAFMDMFNELLEGIPLPIATLLMARVYPCLWLLPAGLIVASLLLLTPKRFPIALACVITVLSIASGPLLKVFLESAVYLPLTKIIENLGV